MWRKCACPWGGGGMGMPPPENFAFAVAFVILGCRCCLDSIQTTVTGGVHAMHRKAPAQSETLSP